MDMTSSATGMGDQFQRLSSLEDTSENIELETLQNIFAKPQTYNNLYCEIKLNRIEILITIIRRTY